MRKKCHFPSASSGRLRPIVWFCLSSACIAGTPAGQVYAHGGPPQAMGIVAAEPNGAPTLVLLNEGLAHRGEDGWTFICPRLWGMQATVANGVPLAGSLDGKQSWIIGADDLYVAVDGVLSAQGKPGLGGNSIVALAAMEDGLFGLRLRTDGTDVLRVDDGTGQVLFTSTEYWSTFAMDSAGSIYLARETAAGLTSRVLDRDGELQATVELNRALPLARVSLRPLDGRLFAILYDDLSYSLLDLSAEPPQTLAESQVPIAGPLQTADGTLWMALSGVLSKLGAQGPEPVGEERAVTCLEVWNGMPYACVSTELYRLEVDGLGERLFTLDGIGAPDPDVVSAEAARDCGYQWQLFRSDLTTLGLSTRQPVQDIMPAAGVAEMQGASTELPAGEGAQEPVAAGAPSDPIVSGTHRASPAAGCAVTASRRDGDRLWLVFMCVFALLTAGRIRGARSRSGKES